MIFSLNHHTIRHCALRKSSKNAEIIKLTTTEILNKESQQKIQTDIMLLLTGIICCKVCAAKKNTLKQCGWDGCNKLQCIQTHIDTIAHQLQT